MNRVQVASTDIREVGYDVEHSVLEIVFHSGGAYKYFAVPYAEYRNLIGAASVGRYFHAHIKGAYAWEKVG